MLPADTSGVTHFKVDDHRDPRLLKYQVLERAFSDRSRDERPISTPFLVYPLPYPDKTITNVVIRNGRLMDDTFPQVTFRDSLYKAIDDRPIKGSVSDAALYFDNEFDTYGVLVAASANDSAFAYTLLPNRDHVHRIFLASGKDQTGDGRWNPGTTVLLVEDYDYDGRAEAFLYISCGRDFPPRVLVCIEPETGKTEWSLPVAATVDPGSFFSCRDSLNPAVLFQAGNPNNGAADRNFSDSVKYLVKLDDQGHVVIKDILVSDYSSLYMCRGEADSLFYLVHRRVFGAGQEYPIGDNATKLLLSKIDKNARSLVSVPVQQWAAGLTCYFDSRRQQNIVMTLSAGGVVRQYDTALKLLSESEPSTLVSFVGRARFAGEAQDCFLFNTTSGCEIYSDRFKRLGLVPDQSLNRFQPLQRDSAGNVEEFVLSGASRFYIGRVHPQRFLDYIKVLFWEYRNVVFLVLSATLVALVLTNYFRRRTKQNLATIEHQKQRLEEAHAALKEAQQKIINQEKYRQAQDIAGGFAHEIRNALFPARTWLAKLQRELASLSISDSAFRDQSRRIGESINRAINMTSLISKYTSLGTTTSPRPVPVAKIVARVIRANEARILSQGVHIQQAGDETAQVLAEEEHLFIIINNLVLNSLDALTNRQNGLLFICYRATGDQAVLSIRDDGEGIPPVNLERVFDTFFTTKPAHGSGIGLAMVKKIVEMYDGSITVESTVGKGTTFTLAMKSAGSGGQVGK